MKVSRKGGAGGERGLTVVELMFVVAIAAVLVTLAVPGFAEFRRSAQMSAAANELVWALHLARSSAMSHGKPVALCLAGADQLCVDDRDRIGMDGGLDVLGENGERAPSVTGWLVFHPAGAGSVSQPVVVGESLHSFRLPSQIRVSATRPSVTFWPAARAGTTSTFELCPAEGRSPGRSIVVSQTGRPRVAAEAPSCAR